MFIYKIHGPEVSEERAEAYKKLMKRGLVDFTNFRIAHPIYKTKPFEVAFKAWWILKGPCGFRTHEDASRFRSDLMVFIHGFVDGLTDV